MKGNTLLDSGILVSAQSLVHIILTHSNSEGHSALLYILSLFQTSTASPNLSPSGADDGDLPFVPLRPGAHLCQKQLVPLLSAVIGAMHKTTDENQAPPHGHPENFAPDPSPAENQAPYPSSAENLAPDLGMGPVPMRAVLRWQGTEVNVG